MIVEVAGRPPEHVKEALINHVNTIKNYKGVEIISSCPSEPKKIEGTEEMYSCFSEVEIEVETFLRLTELIFDFMPSSIEIISPNEVGFNSSDATSLLNTLAGRLYKYDDVARIAQMQVKQMAMKMQENNQTAQKPQNSGLVIKTNVSSSENKAEGKIDKKVVKNKKKKK